MESLEDIAKRYKKSFTEKNKEIIFKYYIIKVLKIFNKLNKFKGNEKNNL